MFGVNYAALFLDSWDFEAFPGDPGAYSCAGKFGLLCDDPTPEYKHNTTFSWSSGAYTAQLRWEYIGEVSDDDVNSTYTVEELDGKSYFNLNGSWQVTDNVKWTLGIDNLLDEEPEFIGDNQEQANTYPATYDLFGRTIYTSVKLTY